MEKLTVATVLKPQGIRGEIKVKVHLDGADALKGVKKVFVGDTPYRVMNVRGSGDTAFMVLGGIADRNAAEALRGKELEALRSDCPALPEGRYYIADLVGCKVTGADGSVFGEVTSVSPAKTDVFYLSSGLCFAAADGVITAVDIQNKSITVDPVRFGEVSMEVSG